MSSAQRSRTPAALVVGSGFGGLAAAIRLQASGVHTVLHEARDKPGGRAYVYEQDGFTFDAGPTVITAPHTLQDLFSTAGRRMEDYVELLPVMPFYELIWEDGDRMDYAGGDTLHQQIRDRSEADAEGYLRFVDYSKRVFEKGYAELADQPFLRFRDMVRVAPDLLRLRADRSVYRTVARYVKDEHVRQALSFHSLLVGGNPFETSSIYTLIHYLERNWGVFFPKGGTGALVRALCKLFVDIGGTLRMSSPIERIEVDRSGPTPVHRVFAGDAKPESYDLVVSNADVHATYSRLYGSHPEARARARRLERSTWSMSLFLLYFGTDRKYDVAHHTILFGRRYEELLREIFHGHRVPDDFSLYLHAPTVTDPSLAPGGSEAFYVLSPVPHLGNADVDWAAFARTYADRLYERLERELPDLRRHIVTERWFTPQDFQHELGAYQGSAFSVAPLLTQSAYFRPHNKDDRIPGLYLVGAGTHPGAGLPGVISSAKATVDLVHRDFGIEAAGIPAGGVEPPGHAAA